MIDQTKSFLHQLKMRYHNSIPMIFILNSIPLCVSHPRTIGTDRHAYVCNVSQTIDNNLPTWKSFLLILNCLFIWGNFNHSFLLLRCFIWATICDELSSMWRRNKKEWNYNLICKQRRSHRVVLFCYDWMSRRLSLHTQYMCSCFCVFKCLQRRWHLPVVYNCLIILL